MILPPPPAGSSSSSTSSSSPPSGSGSSPTSAGGASPIDSTSTGFSLKLVKGSTMASSLLPPPTPLPPLTSINSPFQSAEYLSLLIRQAPNDINRLIEVPPGGGGGGGQAEASGSGSGSGGTSGTGGGGGMMSPEKEREKRRGREEGLWIYEHLRRLPLDLTPLITSLLPLCTRSTCPEMKAGEWQYLCVAHAGGEGGGGGGGKGGDAASCSAIDYILHTVDQHTALWNSSQAFPSRLSIKPGSERFFGQQARRLSRIFGHAWFHHREVFEVCEAETSLYARFLALVSRYKLMSPELLIIPWKQGQGQGRNTGRNGKTGQGGKDAAGPGEGQGKAKGKGGKASGASGDEDEDDDFRRDKVGGGGGSGANGPSTAIKREHQKDFTLRRGVRGGMNGGSSGTIVSGKRRLFEVDSPAEEDEFGDEEDEGNKHADGFSSGSDSDDSNPDEAVNPVMKAKDPDSDEEDEKMVEDIHAESANGNGNGNGNAVGNGSPVTFREEMAARREKSKERRRKEVDDYEREREENAGGNETEDGVEFNV